MKTKLITINPELRKPNKQGLCRIRIRITQNSKHSYTTCIENVRVAKVDWTGTVNKWVSTRHPNYASINSEIKTLITKLENDMLEIKRVNGVVTKEEIAMHKKAELLGEDFLAYWDLKRAEMTDYNNYKGYDTTKDKIIAFEGKSFDFRTINKEWLTRFQKELISNDLSECSIHANIKRIRRIWNMAIEEKLVEQNLYPFGKGGFKLKDPKSTRKIERLDNEELASFMNLTYDRNTLIYYIHKGFLLSFFHAGIRIEDVLTLKVSNFKGGYLNYNMKKGVTNGKLKTFAIIPEVQAILNDLILRDAKPTDYILPFLPQGIESKSDEEYSKLIGAKTSLYNKYLGKIADDIGTDKKLTSHLARHSWAAYIYNKTKDIKLIQENLDHEDIRVTIEYIGKLTSEENDEKLKNIYSDLKTKLKKVA